MQNVRILDVRKQCEQRVQLRLRSAGAPRAPAATVNASSDSCVPPTTMLWASKTMAGHTPYARHSASSAARSSPLATARPP
jgi:hypothetical protein